jgi:hypothetical protein
MVRTNLMQVETFKRRSKIEENDKGEDSDEKKDQEKNCEWHFSQCIAAITAPVSACFRGLNQAWLNIRKVTPKVDSDNHSGSSDAQNQSDQNKKRKHLYDNKLWRCALEVIVDHEVQEFVKDELFQRLIKEKWDSFGWKKYIRRTVAPYLLMLAGLLSVAYLRGNEISAAWPYLSPNGDTSVSFLCLRSANTSSPSAFFAWISDELPAGGLSAAFSMATLVMHCLLVVGGVPFLVWKGWRQRHVRIRDLDTDGDASITFHEIMLFVEKNLHFILDVVGAALIIGATAARLTCSDADELNLLALASIVLCFNFINVMLPFRFFGPLAIMMYKILREDVCHLLSIYSFMLVGFGVGLFLLFQRSGRLLGCNLPGSDGCSPDESPYVFKGVFSSILWLVWVSLGDNVGAVQVFTSNFFKPALHRFALIVLSSASNMYLVCLLMTRQYHFTNVIAVMMGSSLIIFVQAVLVKHLQASFLHLHNFYFLCVHMAQGS